MNASQLFVQCLENEGVTRIFGVPGEENADFVIALDESSIELILTRHEQGAAFMAEVFGRLTGHPGVCLGTLGPGATNLITGVADANMDRAPMLVLTGQGASTRLHKESHQIMDVVRMFEPVTKWAQRIIHPDSIPEVVRKAVRLSRSEKPGACHIELPEDIAKEETTANPLPVHRFRRPGPDDKIADHAFELIRSAKRPIIIAGNGCIRKRASKQLRRFCSRTGIGVVSTFMAKGCVDVDADYCLFTIGLQAKDLVACSVDAADLVITIGYDMVEYHPRLWNEGGRKDIVHIDFLPAEIDANYNPATEMVGDIAHSLWMLNQRTAADPPTFDLSQQSAVRREMLEELALHNDDRTEGSIRPQKAIWDVRRVLAPNDILLSDVGAHKMWVARHYHCHEPNTCLIPNGFCSMGFALPGAIGASLVVRHELDGGPPDRKVLALCGDGGFLMNVQEMETARRLNSDITVLVWQDNSYGLIEWKQDNEFDRHIDLTFGNPDFDKLADAFGWSGIRVERSVDLEPALRDALQTEGPVLVTMPVDYGENHILSERLGNIACPI